MTDFEGRVALITGGGSGIGQAAAIAFGRAGARVVIAGRREEAGEATAQKVRAVGGEAQFLRTDVTDEADVESLITRTMETYGGLDIAVNNAGTEGRIAPIVDLSAEDYDEAMNVNLRGLWLCLRQELRAMMERGSGAVVNISSINGLRGAPGSSLYVAAKHAVIGLTKTVALEVADRGIRVNCLCPGAVHTTMLERVAETFSPGDVERGLTRFESMIPAGRIARPEEMAEAILWLCSPASSYMVGGCLTLDGGLTAR